MIIKLISYIIFEYFTRLVINHHLDKYKDNIINHPLSYKLYDIKNKTYEKVVPEILKNFNITLLLLLLLLLIATMIIIIILPISIIFKLIISLLIILIIGIILGLYLGWLLWNKSSNIINEILMDLKDYVKINNTITLKENLSNSV